MNVCKWLSVSVCLTLAACGGGGGETTATTAMTLSGKAIDGYVQGATVYLDLNFNQQWDDGEPLAVTTDTGDYRLELTEAQQECAQYVPLVVDVPVGAVDQDLGTVEVPYQMVLPPKFEPLTEEDFYHVTPLTTALWSTIQTELGSTDSLSCESVMADQQKREQLLSSLDQAVSRVVEHYNISEQQLYDDFIASGDTETYTKAQAIVRGLQKSFTATEELKRQYPDALNALVDYHQGDYRDNDGGYPDAWYREQYIWWSNKSRNELVKVSDDLSEDVRTIIYGEQSSVSTTDYRYQNSYEFESRDGDSAPYTCDIKETLSTTANDREYTLVNLANGEAEVFADCIPDSLSEAVTHRYALVDYAEAGKAYGSQFIYMRQGGVFTFLNDWVDMAADVGSRDMTSLVTALEALPYRYDDTTAEPDASYWIKHETVSEEDTTVTNRYDSKGNYQRYTVLADGTHTQECSTDGVTWSTCS